MADTKHIKGVDKVCANLTKEIRAIKGRSRPGVMSAGHFVKGKAQAECPVVTGNLKNSAYVKDATRGRKVGAVVGFSAVYALSVHENERAGKTEGVSPSGKEYKAPINPNGKRSTQAVFSTVGKWKFLEDPLYENFNKILDIIRRKAKIK